MRISMKYLLIFFISLLMMACGTVSAQFPQCTKDMAMKAEAEASTLADWNAIYQSFLKYRNCDDAAIAEGYSESISRMLAERWLDVQRLKAITSKDALFEKFVVRHIDETIPMDRLQKIAKYSRDSCPAGEASFCARLEKAAQ